MWPLQFMTEQEWWFSEDLLLHSSPSNQRIQCSVCSNEFFLRFQSLQSRVQSTNPNCSPCTPLYDLETSDVFTSTHKSAEGIKVAAWRQVKIGVPHFPQTGVKKWGRDDGSKVGRKGGMNTEEQKNGREGKRWRKEGRRKTESKKVTSTQLHLTQQFSGNLSACLISIAHCFSSSGMIYVHCTFYHQAIMSSAGRRSDSIMQSQTLFFSIYHFLFTIAFWTVFPLRANAAKWRKMFVLLVIEWINHWAEP